MNGSGGEGEVLNPVEVEQLVAAYATAALLAQTGAGAALLAELGLAVA